MSFNAPLMARAAVTRIENADPSSLEEAGKVMEGFASQMTKAQLCQVVGHLAKWVLVAEDKTAGGAS